ncbi:MAG: tRNA (adenosine(37)-N6)-dimethylallyltransferase MiaA [OCS116 cluster bacterium]|uniref:tRNA dimethylallyltransferase n=1 Tax=OCS116 cluster bacterium TaxID=2030921 RepID=A0A2A4YRU9_9PROT|nr:tRNA (adenosine(37)-N6)-dimethylallyltransferase MiaA [OCS116 cluster bacterium]
MSNPFQNIGDFIDIDAEHKRNIILIAGATASGKSSIAISLAQQFDGVVLNADSMQVYQELRVISARPSAAEAAQAEHRMFGHMSVAEPYSVGHWLDQVTVEIIDILKQGRTPIIVGGTGLYFTSLVDGISPIPDIAPDIRTHWRAQEDGLHQALIKIDPTLADRLEPNDKQRIIRGLEVFHSTGRTLSDWQANEPLKQFLPPIDGLQLHKFTLQPERQYLYDRINQRFDMMVELGGIEEVKALMAMGLPSDMTALKAIGVRQINQALIGNVSMDEAIEKSKTESRRYAKRQMTWQKGNLITYNSVTEQQSERKLVNILSKISF